MGVKYDSGKVRFDLVPVAPLRALAQVYQMGAVKYEDNGWRSGLAWSRIYAALQRHLLAFWEGQDLDDESGLPHLAHAAWGTFTLLEYMNTHPQLDDRYATKARNNVLPVGAPALAADGIPDETLESVYRGTPGSLVLGRVVRPVAGMEVSTAAEEERDSRPTGSVFFTDRVAESAVSRDSQ